MAAASSPEAVLAAFGEPLPDRPTAATDVIDLLAHRAEPGLTAVGSGRVAIGDALRAARECGTR